VDEQGTGESNVTPDQGIPEEAASLGMPRAAPGSPAPPSGAFVPATSPTSATATCPECGTPYAAPLGAVTTPATMFAYAIGRVEPRFPSIAVEKEFAQAAGAGESATVADRERLSRVLKDPDNRYLADQMCWVFVAQGMDAFMVRWRDVADRDHLIDTIGTAEDTSAIDAVVGWVDDGWDVGLCGNLRLPSVRIIQLLSFSREEFVAGVPAPENTDDGQFRAAVGNLFERVARRSDNTGQSDEHRALNYVALRYPALYEIAAQAFAKEMSLVTIDARRGAAGWPRRIVEVWLIFRGRRDDVVEQYRCRVDVTEVFPFLVSPLEPTFD
jgi:hypothetical protein